MSEISVLKGKTLASVDADEYKIIFTTTEGEVYKMHHCQDCCENVSVEDVCGDWEDIIGSPILVAEESTNSEDTFGNEYCDESFTWTFYKLDTFKGGVTIRWFGSSNGYYSESVDFDKIN
jgi:hypothetical protein